MLEVIGHIRRMGFLGFLQAEWHTHGDLTHIQIGPRGLVLAVHPDAVRTINVTNRDNYDKLSSYDNVRKYLLGDGLLTATGDQWRRQRKLMAPFFTPRGVEQFMPIILNDTRDFMARWDKQASQGTVSDMLGEMMLVTASIILKSLFTTESDETLLELKADVETMIQFVSTRENNRSSCQCGSSLDRTGAISRLQNGCTPISTV